MNLDAIRAALSDHGLLVPTTGGDADLTDISDDSRLVQPGALFCAVRGSDLDGHDFVHDAVRAGAAAILAERPVEVPVPTVLVSHGRRAAAVAAATWFGHPAHKLEVVGVTGTNGKSTTVAMIRHVLNERGTVGWLGTLGGFDGAGDALYREGLTTPGAIGLQRSLHDLVSRGCTRVVLEASSHALDQDRLHGVPVRAGVFTNLSHDHLDYHQSFDAYRDAKTRLADLITPTGAQIVNADDPAWTDLPLGPSQTRLRFGRAADADVRMTSVLVGPEGSEAALVIADTDVRMRIPHLGTFNVDNAVAALTTARVLGCAVEHVLQRLEHAPQVPGRMERLCDAPLVLRDYAHTPDALERAIAAARPLARGRLLVLFGCGGDRDQKKRAPMARIGVRGADVAIMTSDNPRTEDPERILDDMAEGVDGRSYLRITDRREAIERAVAMMEPGDCLLLAGKGHETYQVLGRERVPFDERDVVRDIVTAGRS